jgi:hypothetical protein
VRTWILVAVIVPACGRIGFAPFGGDAFGPPTCSDAILDGDETGIDCGGSCLPCAGVACSNGAQCASGNCVVGACELASGPPFWLPGPDLLVATQDLACATEANGGLIAIAGNNGSGVIAITEVLAAGASAFAAGPSLQNARDHLAGATTSDGTVYAFGGNGATGVPSSLEALIAGVWTPRTGTTGGHADIGAAGGLDGKLYVVDNDGIWIYTPGTDSWSSGPAPSTPRDLLAVARGPDGFIYAIGGRDNNNNVVAAVDAWDPSQAQWLRRADLHAPHETEGVVMAGDGRIYAIAGNTPTGQTSSVEAYVADRDLWVDVAPATIARDGTCAALGADGRIYVVGGQVVNTIASVEIYGPVIALSPATAAPGASVSVTGSNFAASAAVAVTFDGTTIATGTTDSSGAMALDVVVPAATSGAHKVVGVDAKSQFPTSAQLQVP